MCLQFHLNKNKNINSSLAQLVEEEPKQIKDIRINVILYILTFILCMDIFIIICCLYVYSINYDRVSQAFIFFDKIGSAEFLNGIDNIKIIFNFMKMNNLTIVLRGTIEKNLVYYDILNNVSWS